jgi:xanthosine utilization system XapX-like protein
MLMELLLNSKKKQSLKRTIENSEKTVRTVKVASSAILTVGLLGGILYALINLLSPTLSMVSVQGVLRKDIGKIVFFSSIFLIPGLLIPLFLKYLLINLVFQRVFSEKMRS